MAACGGCGVVPLGPAAPLPARITDCPVAEAVPPMPKLPTDPAIAKAYVDELRLVAISAARTADLCRERLLEVQHRQRERANASR